MVRIAAILIGLITLLVLAFPESATVAMGTATAWFIEVFGAAVLWFSSLCLLLCVFLMLGPWGRLRLGRESEGPEFSTFSWVSMLFAAGMGSGLVFWGAAEPLYHTAKPPLTGMAGMELYSTAMAVTYFHWGLHAWALYAVAGLVVAWFTYRHAAVEAPSGVIEAGLQGWLSPGWRIKLGVTANVLAIAAVVFGLAGALANGTILLRHGLIEASGVSLPDSLSYAVILAGLGLAFLASAISGIRRGILWLSNLNVVLAVVLLALVLWRSDPGMVSRLLWQGTLRYLEILPAWSFNRTEVDGSLAWSSGWTITYLLWWIAWTPFVGIFIARISRGRSLRSYVLGVVGVPVLFSMAWFAVMGGGALAYDTAHSGSLLAAVQHDYTAPLFLWFVGMPGGLGALLSYLACVLLFVFIVTSADSASYVMGMLSRNGDPNPPYSAKLLWGSITMLLAVGLLARQSADVNKAVAIVGAIPYSALLFLQLVAWTRSFAGTVGKGQPQQTG